MTTGSAAIQIGLVPLCEVRIELGVRAALPGTPAGDRVISEIAAMVLSGDRLQASLHGRAAADWLVVTPDGRLGLMDIRCAVVTNDGALIYMQYHGRMRYAPDGSQHTLYVAPRFETGSPKYAWLNEVQCVGKGLLDPATRVLVYMFYEVT